ncbi:MAG: hypothetical protein V2I33_08470 [Kangiellaceae bacterium]|jgi:hypothetical protein|nr:hypothetical protein [Kangiellaceae bacterium]
MLGVGLFYAGYIAVFDLAWRYTYMSKGVVLEGESKDIFDNWDNRGFNDNSKYLAKQ